MAGTTITITQDEQQFVAINRFEPAPSDQDELVRILEEGLRDEMAPLDGFVSAAVHKSTNSPDVVVYAHWDAEASLDAAGRLVQGGGAPNMMKAFQMGAPEYHPFVVTKVVGARG